METFGRDVGAFSTALLSSSSSNTPPTPPSVRAPAIPFSSLIGAGIAAGGSAASTSAPTSGSSATSYQAPNGMVGHPGSGSLFHHSPFEPVTFPDLFNNGFSCELCGEVYNDQQSLFMHRSMAHYFEHAGMFNGGQTTGAPPIMDTLWFTQHSTAPTYAPMHAGSNGFMHQPYQYQFMSGPLPPQQQQYAGPLVQSSIANIQQAGSGNSSSHSPADSAQSIMYASHTAAMRAIIKSGSNSPHHSLQQQQQHDQNRQPTAPPLLHPSAQQHMYSQLQLAPSSAPLAVKIDYDSADSTPTTSGGGRRARAPATKASNRARPADAKPFECDLCGMKIKHKRNIYRHKRTRHNVTHVSDGSGNVINKPLIK